MVLGQKICRILLRCLVWKVNSLFRSLSVILSHSFAEPYSRVARTHLWLGVDTVLGCPPHVVQHFKGISGLAEKSISDSAAQVDELFSCRQVCYLYWCQTWDYSWSCAKMLRRDVFSCMYQWVWETTASHLHSQHLPVLIKGSIWCLLVGL